MAQIEQTEKEIKFYCKRCGKVVDKSELFLDPFVYDGQTIWLHSPLSCCGIAEPLSGSTYYTKRVINGAIYIDKITEGIV